MVGIYGVGGIGKTTLAKAIYNRIFQHFGSSYFLSNVRSETEAFGLAKLQEELLRQILKTKEFKVSSVAEGTNLIKSRLGSKKVLIILDDVDHISQLESLTRERGGLPLALVTLGAHLRGRSVEEWRYEIQKLRAIPHSDIQKILKISFDGLDCDTQSVFLDIACAFHGFSEVEVTETLNACGVYSKSAIATLVQKCLLQISGMDHVVMHGLVRDMGREIVRMESP
ncbi:disease resistance protein L6-like [Lycium barbarum]|uniref:disease resistance protein L6-like n=1 Tax=Lycium barbarum TaxID=112863 RepID=UPI00293E4885|nr:disease resistance protein L6-like [Lycium barbarum]